MGGGGEEEKGKQGGKSKGGEEGGREEKRKERENVLKMVSNMKEKRYQRGLGIVGKKLGWFCCHLFFVWRQVTKPPTMDLQFTM